MKPPFNIVHIYGQNEGRAGQQNILEGWKEILKELGNIKARNEGARVVGDLNRAVGSSELGVKGNSEKVSYGGQLIRELISAGDYLILNNLSIAKGGPWTRICPGDGGRSCLDLAIGSRELVQYVSSVQVDCERQYTPRRAVLKQGKISVTYTDHLPVLVQLEMPKTEPLEKVPSNWNLNKPGGWKEYEEEGEKVAEKLCDIIEAEGDNSEVMIEKFERLHNKMKYKAFGKTKPKTMKAECREIKADESEEEQAKCILKKQSDKIEAEIIKVKSLKQGRVNNVFKMREVVVGKKKARQEAHAVVDEETKELVVSNAEIKRVTLDYCMKVLKNNEPAEEFKVFANLKEEVHRLQMEDKEMKEETDITLEYFFLTLVKFESKKSATYSFIDNAGLKFRLAIFKLCTKLIKNEAFPESFDNTTLVQLPKKGSQLHLDNSRFIHMKQWLPRLVEALTVRGMKNEILSAGTKYQIGGCPGQRTQFHLFVVRSLIAIRRKEGEGCIITAVDIKKFFDRQSLAYAMNTLHRAKVKKKLYRVWYKLNEKTTIEV